MSDPQQVVVRIDRGLKARVQGDPVARGEFERAVRLLRQDAAPAGSTVMIRDGSARALRIDRFVFVYDVRGGGREVEIFAIADRSALGP